jgi:putative phosphoribosyl transferase
MSLRDTCALTFGCSPNAWLPPVSGRASSPTQSTCPLATLVQAPALARPWWPRPSAPDLVGAIVSRGGRPDLAGPALPLVKAPTLLIVGGRDEVVIEPNQRAFDQLRCEKRLEIVQGATHLFEEPGTLEQVARLARDWFVRYLAQTDENRANVG